MSDGTTDAGNDPAQPTPTETPTESTIVSFIGEDGTLKEGWRDFVPEDVRKDKVFDRAKSLGGVFKSLASAERMIGTDKIAKPGPNSTEDDWNAYYLAGGAKEKVEDYKFDKGDITDDQWPEGISEAMQKAAFDAKLNDKQLGTINTAFNEYLKAQIMKSETDTQLKHEEQVNKLKAEWTGNFDANIHLGNIALEKGTDGDPELKERIKEKFGPDPDFARLLRNLGVSYKEDSVHAQETSPITADQVDEQLVELMASDAFNNKMNPGHKTAIAKQARLLEQKAKIR